MRGAASVAGERVTDQKFKSKSAMKHALQEEGEKTNTTRATLLLSYKVGPLKRPYIEPFKVS